MVAFLFGRGADGATCPCDSNKDGVTNPAPINGNDRPSLNEDDDGATSKSGRGPTTPPGARACRGRLQGPGVPGAARGPRLSWLRHQKHHRMRRR